MNAYLPDEEAATHALVGVAQEIASALAQERTVSLSLILAESVAFADQAADESSQPLQRAGLLRGMSPAVFQGTNTLAWTPKLGVAGDGATLKYTLAVGQQWVEPALFAAAQIAGSGNALNMAGSAPPRPTVPAAPPSPPAGGNGGNHSTTPPITPSSTENGNTNKTTNPSSGANTVDYSKPAPKESLQPAPKRETVDFNQNVQTLDSFGVVAFHDTSSVSVTPAQQWIQHETLLEACEEVIAKN
jgi:hypothetical protein